MKTFVITSSAIVVGVLWAWAAWRVYLSYSYEVEVERLNDTVERVIKMHNECNHTTQYLDSVINSMVEEGCKK